MSKGAGKCNQIRQIVKLRHMLLRWRRRATDSSSGRAAGVPADVPEGHVAIRVGWSSRRFVVRASYLNHPVFQKVLAQAEAEYGFAHQGPLSIPCDEAVFEEILRFVDVGELRRWCGLVGFQTGFGESRSMLQARC